MSDSSAEFHLLSNGQLLQGAAEAEVINPYDESVVARCPLADPAVLDRSVEAARAAFQEWRNTSFALRRGAVLKLADILDANVDLLGQWLTLEQGKPLERAREEVAFAAIYARYFADQTLEPELIADGDGVRVELLREPIGVVAGICPWNFPLLIAVYKLVPAILAGNTVIIKPAPTTPLTTLKLGELVRDVFPAGVLNILADDNTLGPLISAHPGIDQIAFTGSTPVGRAIMGGAAATLKRLNLELGGNDPGIVLEDADPKTVAEGVFNAAFFNSGQVCIALKRLYVQRPIYAAVCQELAILADKAVVGDGLAEGTQFGPVQNAAQFQRLIGLLDSARRAGASVLAGGQHSDRGYCMQPTILGDLDAQHELVQQEQFGPLLPVVAFDDVDAVIEQINQGEYGLGASVWSADRRRALELARRIDCGTVWINQHLNFGPHIPLPATKQSGNGVEWGREGFLEYTRARIVNMATA